MRWNLSSLQRLSHLCTVPGKVFAGIVMSSTAPTFCHWGAGRRHILCTTHANQIVVDKLVPPVSHSHSYVSDGIVSWGGPVPMTDCCKSENPDRLLRICQQWPPWHHPLWWYEQMTDWSWSTELYSTHEKGMVKNDWCNSVFGDRWHNGSQFLKIYYVELQSTKTTQASGWLLQEGNHVSKGLD